MHIVFEELTHKYNPIPNTFMHQNLVTVFPQHFSIYICFSHVNVKRNITMCTTTHRGAKNNLFTIEIRYTVPASRVHPRCDKAHNCLGPILGR